MCQSVIALNAITLCHKSLTRNAMTRNKDWFVHAVGMGRGKERELNPVNCKSTLLTYLEGWWRSTWIRRKILGILMNLDCPERVVDCPNVDIIGFKEYRKRRLPRKSSPFPALLCHRQANNNNLLKLDLINCVETSRPRLDSTQSLALLVAQRFPCLWKRELVGL